MNDRFRELQFKSNQMPFEEFSTVPKADGEGLGLSLPIQQPLSVGNEKFLDFYSQSFVGSRVVWIQFSLTGTDRESLHDGIF
jgi:hypothetical protein